MDFFLKKLMKDFLVYALDCVAIKYIHFKKHAFIFSRILLS